MPNTGGRGLPLVGMIIQLNVTESFQSPVARVLLAVIAAALLYVLWKEIRKIPARLFALMATAFMDMVGLLMIIPLLPFYVKQLGGSGIDILGLRLGIGSITGFIVAAFTIGMFLTPPDVISQTLLAVPMWLLFELGLVMSRWLLPHRAEAATEDQATN